MLRHSIMSSIVAILAALCGVAFADEAGQAVSSSTTEVEVVSQQPAPPAVPTRYAAMILGERSEEAKADYEDVHRTVRLLLEDPMVGAFAVDAVDFTTARPPASLDDFTVTLAARGGADLALVYITGKVGGSEASPSTDALMRFPGKLKVIVVDGTAPGPEGARPTMAVEVAEKDGAAGVVFRLSGAASEDASPAALLAAALRGSADEDRNRKITVSELAAALAGGAEWKDEYDLGAAGAAQILQYSTPAEMVKAVGADKAMELAAKYEREQFWVETLLVLKEVRKAKLGDPEFRRISETAQLQLGLETRYAKDSRDENTSRDVKTGLELMADVLQLANLHYVRDVDNRDLYAGGARNIQLLLENRRLRRLLCKGAGDAEVREFEAFVKSSVDHVYENDALTENDFLMRIKRVIMESDATVKLAQGVVVTEFLYGITASLDPHTAYIPAQAYKEFQEDTIGHFGGLGIEITLENKVLTVVTPLDNTPASEAGLLPGDRITKIDGVSTTDMPLEQAVERLRGPIGTKVVVTILHRNDTTPVEVTLARANILLESIKGYEVDADSGEWRYLVDPANSIGYIRMTDFKESTPTDLETAVTSLLDAGMKGLVLDLRGNRGGLLNSGVKISDLFVNEGTIVTVRGAHCRPSDYKAHYFRTFKSFPLAVLMNEDTASAAEILAGALQDHARGSLVGTQSFGKGTVQTIFELERGMSALKLTTAKYYTPKGVSIHRDEYSTEGGLVPDYMVEMDDEEYLTLAEVWHLRGLRRESRERLMNLEREIAAKNPEFKLTDPAHFRDRQLEKALEVLRSQMAGIPVVVETRVQTKG